MAMKFEDDNKELKYVKWLGILLLCLVLGTIFTGFWYTISAGERGVLLTFGKPSPVEIGEGLHFKWPLIQSIQRMDIKVLKLEADASAASKDLQTVTAKIVTNYRIEPTRAVEIYTKLGKGYATTIIAPLEQETVKAIISKFTAEELITKREEVRQEIKMLFAEKLIRHGVIIEEVSITNFDFSPSFNAAIESKVTAEQLSLQAKNKLEQIKYEAEQRITTATAEAEAIKIQAQSINSQGGADYVRLKAIEKWDGKTPIYSGSGLIPFVNIN